jgi:hypothetical protein
MEKGKNLEQNLDKSNEKLHISDVMSRFKKWLRKPLTTKQVIIMYITWVLMILYTIFCK